MPSTSSRNETTETQSRWIARAPRPLLPWLGGLAVAAILVGPVLSHHPALADELDSAFKLSAGSSEYGPTVSIVQPSFNDVVRGVTPIVLAVQNRRYPAKTVEMFVDDQLATPGGLAMNALPSAQFNWDTARYVDGPHRLTVRVTDTQGFIGVSEVTVFVNNNASADIEPPTLAWLGVKSGDVLKGQQNLRMAVSDNFGVKMLIVQLYRADAPADAIHGWFMNRPPYTVKLDTAQFPDALYILNAKAFDVLENQGDAASLYLGFSNYTISPTEQSQMMEKLAQLSGRKADVKPGKEPTKVVVAPPVNPNKNATPPTPAGNTSAPNAGPASDNVKVATNNDVPNKANPGDTGWMPGGDAGQTSGASNVRVLTPPHTTMAPRYAVTLEGIARARPLLDAKTPTTPRQRASAPQVGLREVPPLLNTRPIGAPRPSVANSVAAHETRIASAALPGQTSSRRAPSIASRPFGALRPVKEDQSAAPVKTEPVKMGENIAPVAPLSQSRTGAAVPSFAETPTVETRIAKADLPELSIAPRMPPAQTSRPFGALRPVQENESVAPVAPPSQTYFGAAVPSFAETPIIGTRIAKADLPELSIAPRVPPAQASRPVGTVRSLEITMPVSLLSRSALTAPATSALPMMSPNTRIAALAGENKWAAQTPRPSTPARITQPRVTQPMAALPAAPRQQKAVNAGASITVAPASSASIGKAKLPATYIAPRDEALAAIAHRFHLPVTTLASVNALSVDAKLKKGATLRLPQPLVVMVDGKPVNGDVGAVLVNSVAAAPFRFLFEQQGGTMTWDGAAQRVTASKGDLQVTLTIGSQTALVNQKEVMMDLAAFLLSGRTMVPVRFFEDALNAEVEWEPTTGRLYIAMSMPGK